MSYARNVALLWLQREKKLGYVTADILWKACGILSEEILSADLNELEIPHVRTLPLFTKDHPVNKGKPYDIKIGNVTIDVKANPPIPCFEKCKPSEGINLTAKEVEENGPCDLYVATKDYPELPFVERPDKYDEKVGMEFAEKILKQITSVKFLGWATKAELIQKENLKQGYSPHYQLFAWELHKMTEFAVKFGILLEPKVDDVDKKS